MNWLPTFAAWPFAVAGAASAIATLLIHLLNRRRPRTIRWGAMEFLREALKKNQRTIRWRDAILVALRCIAIFLFAIALARPHFANHDDASAFQPVHLIMVVDNSLSMSFETLDGTLLSRAKQSAIDLLGHLPPGSVVSTVPAIDFSTESVRTPHADVDEAGVAISGIQLVDQSTSLQTVLARIEQAASLSADLPIRVVFFTDLQATTWLDTLPSPSLVDDYEWQLVDVSPARRENAWVADVSVQGGFAIDHAPTSVMATIGRSGGRADRSVEVALLVDDVIVASRSVTFPAGDSTRLVEFSHQFAGKTNDAPAPAMSIVKVEITHDRLSRDDERHAIVPVFGEWPVVFVDQTTGEQEDPSTGRLGETRPLRHLIMPRTPGSGERELVHLAFDELRDQHLAGARAVVVAGVRDPSTIAGVLRTFTENGGQLLIAAGADFDPAAWNTNAWLGGRGILPAPLDGGLRGSRPSESEGELQVWTIDAESISNNSLFLLEANSTEDLFELYSEPLVFKHVSIEEPASGGATANVLSRLRPASVPDQAGAEDRPPLLIERKIGDGRALMWTTGIRPQWNTLAKTNAVVLLDRIVRDLVAATLPRQHFAAGEQIEVPSPAGIRLSEVTLQRPGEAAAAPINNGRAVDDRSQFAIDRAMKKGVYRLSAVSEASGTVWSYPIVAHSPVLESRLDKVERTAIARFAKNRNVKLAKFADAVNLRGLFQPRHGMSWWLALTALALLFVESTVLATARLSSRRNPLGGSAESNYHVSSGQTAT